ncbi:hypothetical protein KSP39_PZI020884 [Platanthera zijinensis]|uniref:Hemerythrin-like domain-containing protein n=1 Tax=Platanthera zijinensis TaxID=2320716 RepID=A0AAP0FX74_9ASPA
MGNCSPKPRRRPRSSKTPADPLPPATAAQLHGQETCLIAWRIRVALLYKGAAVDFVESGTGDPFLLFGSAKVEGSEESLLRYIDKKFGGPQAASAAAARDGKGTLAGEVVMLQHRSIQRHVEGMVYWARKMSTEGADWRMGRAAEGRRMGKWYAELVEMMLEHAQMEERLLFPALDRAADYEICRAANEQHGRDLPIMNGIKEDIKSLMAMEVGGLLYRETLPNLSLRFTTLQEHCKQHFQEEERELLPLLESAESFRREEGEEPWPQDRWVQQVVALMEATHSRHFPFFMAALLPCEALRYIALIAGDDDRRSLAMLRSVAAALESSPRPSWFDRTQ